jgi:S-formylglutathione hydrolase
MTPLSQNKIFGGVQSVYSHRSEVCQSDMKVGVFVPDGVTASAPALIFLSGLTCTEQNFVTKAGAQRVAAELGLVLIAPDTSPRGEDVPDSADEYDFGKGAGFYLDATRMPWMKNYSMQNYIRDELTAWMADALPVDMTRIGITGHSMGGHGALTLHLKNPKLFKTCSAFAPIVAPSQVPWGKKAFGRYLGEEASTWAQYDAVELVGKDASSAEILIDQGTDDQFLTEQLKPDLFEAACTAAGQSLTLRMQRGYDHSYYFIASFIEDHLRHHAARL